MVFDVCETVCILLCEKVKNQLLTKVRFQLFVPNIQNEHMRRPEGSASSTDSVRLLSAALLIGCLDLTRRCSHPAKMCKPFTCATLSQSVAMRQDYPVQAFIPRKLQFSVGTEIREIGHEVLLEMAGNVVLLGEAGGGKTRLTEELGRFEGFERCTARQLLNGVPQRILGNATVLVIDALDEVAVKAEGDAVDHVLRSLREVNFPRFILSCRSAEWRAATMREAIREQYGDAPTEVILAPLTDEDAHKFLAGYLDDHIRAAQIVQHFRQRGLSEWLGNPQTLAMLGDVADGDLPDTATALFSQFVDRAWFEHSKARPDAPLRKLGEEAVLDSLGAAFVALILTGSEALSDEPRHEVLAGDIALTELAQLPGAQNLEAALKNRLCKGPAERRTFQHKRIGEYLGARWLAKWADTPTKRSRLIGMLRIDGIVPANLRGIHAWLAMDPHLAPSVIRSDPTGVIEYGDADSLTEPQGRILLEALEDLSQRNPLFSTGRSPRARSLVKGALREDSWRILTEQDDAGTWRFPFALRIVIAEQLSDPEVVEERRSELLAMLMDQKQSFAIRAAAGEALAVYGNLPDWPSILESLRSQATEDSCRLSIRLLEDVGLDRFSDRQIVELVLAYAGITICAFPRQPDERRTVGVLFFLRYQLPHARLDAILDEFANYLEPYVEDHSIDVDDFELRSLVGELVVRRLAITASHPLRSPVDLWRWLRPFRGIRGLVSSKKDEIAEWLRGHDEQRRAIQRYVLIDMECDKDVRARQWQLLEPLPGAALESADVAALLDGLEVSDRRWRDLLTIIYHDKDRGAEARSAAKRFVANRPDMLRWIDSLTTPKVPSWQAREHERMRKRMARDAVRNAEHRAAYLADRDKLLTGEIGAQPAQAYLGHFSDLPKDAPPQDRIAQWLGEDLQADAFQGFEAYLTRDPPALSAEQIAESWAEERYFPIAWVLVAALMERLRNRKGFGGLTDERLIAAMLQIEHGLARSEEAKELGDALEAELLRRGSFEAYARLLIEPHLRTGRAHITGLYGLMRGEDHLALASKLAAEWLQRYSIMASDVEEELIDRLIRANETQVLCDLAMTRCADASRDERSRRNWQAVALWTDFDGVKSSFEEVVHADPALLWAVRDRLSGGRHGDGAAVLIPARLAAWLVEHFRAAWKFSEYPGGVRSGERNAWDATQYLSRLIGQLGDDPSDEAVALVARLRDAPQDGYTAYLRRVATEQEAKRAELAYTPPTVADLANALGGSAPATMDALKSEVLAALERVQARIRSDATDCWRGFYQDDGKTPRAEEDCSDHLVNLLRIEAPEILFEPEVHVGSDREVDIGCSVKGMRIPIEAKGQWNRDLWTAADWQLGGQQAVDHLAQGHGIYLVYWFGPQAKGKKVQNPPIDSIPKSPDELRCRISKALAVPERKNLAVAVLDISR